jgi:hypothetical protein
MQYSGPREPVDRRLDTMDHGSNTDFECCEVVSLALDVKSNPVIHDT